MHAVGVTLGIATGSQLHYSTCSGSIFYLETRHGECFRTLRVGDDRRKHPRFSSPGVPSLPTLDIHTATCYGGILILRFSRGAVNGAYTHVFLEIHRSTHRLPHPEVHE